MTASGSSGEVAAPFRSVYLGAGPDTTLALLHLPRTGTSADVAVLLCPPFGWDDVCSYRSRRAWSEALADAGYPSVRIDLPGSGDSGGSPRTPRRLDAWMHAVSMTARWLRDETGCARIAAIGLGLGGSVAYAALARGAEIDDLVLWAVPARGRACVRELAAASVMGRKEAGADANPNVPDDGSIEVNGFVMTRETLEAFKRLDLTELALPEASRRRVLMLGRDGLAPDSRLREHLERAGAAVSVADGRGYGLMMQDPRLAQPPRQVFAQTMSWLADTPSFPARPPCADGSRIAPPSHAAAQLACEGGSVLEAPFSLPAGEGRLFGILSEPAAGPWEPLTAVLFNTGGVRRIGPNRIWVEIARSWAAQGVPTLRVDLAGIGDSDGDESAYVSNAAFYTPEMTEQALTVLDAVVDRGLPSRFILGGLCSGAYWSFRAAAQDERVVGALMINLVTFLWSDQLAAMRSLRNARAVLRGRSLDSWGSQEIREAALRILRTSLGRRVNRTSRLSELGESLDHLRDRRVELLLQFSADEALYEDLARDGVLAQLDRWPNLHLERLPSNDHTFRALPLQALVRRGLDDALRRTLERTAESVSDGRQSDRPRAGSGAPVLRPGQPT